MLSVSLWTKMIILSSFHSNYTISTSKLYIQWALLNGITVNGIIRLMGSYWYSPKYLSIAYFEYMIYSVIVIIRLMLSVSFRSKEITLSCCHCNYTIYTSKLFKNEYKIIVIIWILGSVMVWPKVIAFNSVNSYKQLISKTVNLTFLDFSVSFNPS
jgi:hypothetical protein